MAVIGVELPQDELVLTKGRDFKWAFVNLGADGSEEDFPDGSLYIELKGNGVDTTWPFTIDGSNAVIKVESDQVDEIPNKTRFHLVFQETGELAGGDPLARGFVRIQE